MLMPLLYLEEDWRGARELAAAKQRWQDAGYSLNPTDYYPPPVPDEQNLAALPIFNLEPDPKDPNHPKSLLDVRLREATDERQHGGWISSNDKKKTLAAYVADAYAKQFPQKAAPASVVAQFEELYPLIVDLRTAAATRTAFRMNQDYGFQPVWGRPLSLVTSQIEVAKLLSYDAQLALLENQPQIAVGDIKVGFQIAKGVGTDPTLVGGLVSYGVSAITRSTVDQGLRNHVWNDAQLAQIQDALKQVDCLAIFQLDMRSECVTFGLTLIDALKANPSLMRLLVGNYDDENNGAPSIVSVLLWRVWASGWWDMNAAQKVDFYLRTTQCVDAKTRTVHPKRSGAILSDIEKKRQSLWGPAPWNILYLISAGAMTGACEKSTQAQAQLDEDRIVCGLERYRLAHGAYPPSLDALAPAYIDELPHDILNGAAYHYRLNANGTFLLYSVGWNQTDDGGTIALKSGYTKPQIDFDNGDWVWPMVPR